MLLEILQLFWLPWNKSAFVRIICHLRCYSLCFICKFKLRWLRSYYSEYCRFSSIIFVHFFYQLKFKNKSIDVSTSFILKYKLKNFAICFKKKYSSIPVSCILFDLVIEKNYLTKPWVSTIILRVLVQKKNLS